MNNYSYELQNGLTVSCDYIAFTVTAPYNVTDVILMLGFMPDDFHEMPKGGFGYKKQLKCESNGISILYDGAKEMGIHVNVTGRGIHSLLQAFSLTQTVVNPFDNLSNASPLDESVLSLFFHQILQVGHFTRIDMAIDDFGGNFFAPDDVFKLYQNGQVVSKWRTVKRNDRFSAPRTCDGYTLYFGSRDSTLMLRIYDKMKEQNKKLTPEDEGYIDFNWYRWELEFKDERAIEFARHLIDGVNVGSLVVGVLHYYIRLIHLDDCNKSRCSNLELWDDFILGIESKRLHFFKKQKTVIDKITWLEKQVAPTLAALLLLYEFDDRFIYEIAQKNKMRISKGDWELIREHRPDIYDMYHVE